MSDNKKYGYCIQFECKKFYFINEKYDLFYNCDRLLSEIKSDNYRYNTDGIIFSSSTLGQQCRAIRFLAPSIQRCQEESVSIAAKRVCFRCSSSFECILVVTP